MNGIEYLRLSDAPGADGLPAEEKWYEMQQILDEEEIELFSKYIVPTSGDRALHNLIPWDSEVEKNFVQDLESRNREQMVWIDLLCRVGQEPKLDFGRKQPLAQSCDVIRRESALGEQMEGASLGIEPVQEEANSSDAYRLGGHEVLDDAGLRQGQ